MSAYECQVVKDVAQLDKKPRVRSAHAHRKILFVTHTEEYGGLEKHLLDMIRKLSGSGVDLSILNLGPDLYTERLDRDDANPVSVACMREPMSFRSWLKVLREDRPDVVVFSCGWVWSFPFASIAAWLAGVPRRYAIQHLVSPPLQKTRGRSPRKVFRKLFGETTRRLVGLRVAASFFDRTICVSNAVRKSLLQDFSFPANKTVTIYNGVSVSQFSPSEGEGAAVRTRLGIGAEEFLLVCAARLAEIKRIDILLEAIARVVRDGVSCKCVILGDGPLREQLSEQSHALGLSGRVFFEGFHEDVRPYLHAASAFILTSRLEGLPLSLLEAMACGLPSIVTDVGGNAEAIIDGEQGLVVPSGSVDAVAGAISYLATHTSERARMSASARARACEAFNIETRMTEITNAILA